MVAVIQVAVKKLKKLQNCTSYLTLLNSDIVETWFLYSKFKIEGCGFSMCFFPIESILLWIDGFVIHHMAI
jgi:hypothetical protein